MNVTRNGNRDRKLNIGYPQMVSSEKKEYEEVFCRGKITENTNINGTFVADELFEKILHRDNMNKAYKKVVSNKGAGGVDGMSATELLQHLKDTKEELLESLRLGKYKPNPVRRVEIPKEEKGKVRKLGIPTVVDRMIQQSITQVISPIYEEQFSDSSFGFRPNRSAHDALKKCQIYVNQGYKYVVDMDLEKFFDKVNHSKLMEIVSKTVKDRKVLSLIHRYLNAGLVQNGMFERTAEGVPQGGPLSPLLSNIMLNELDKELERRGHKFVRYADDCMILCKSKRGAKRILENIIPYIEKKLFLKVNREKTVVEYVGKVKFLGYGFMETRGKCKLKVHKKSKEKLLKKMRELTNRSNGMGNLQRMTKIKQLIHGWVNYFKLADMKKFLAETDELMRRRIRAVYWKQWKKVRTRIRELISYGLEKWKALEIANTRKGSWRTSIVLNTVLTNKVIAAKGFETFSSYYAKCKVN